MLYIAADHAGFDLKEQLTRQLTERSIPFEDFGTFHPEQADSYVGYANQVVKAMKQKHGWGVLICGTGVGMCIAANRQAHIRAALVWNIEVARRSREEDDANVICLPARIIDERTAWQCLTTFLSTTFTHEDRYKRRISQLDGGSR